VVAANDGTSCFQCGISVTVRNAKVASTANPSPVTFMAHLQAVRPDRLEDTPTTLPRMITSGESTRHLVVEGNLLETNPIVIGVARTAGRLRQIGGSVEGVPTPRAAARLRISPPPLLPGSTCAERGSATTLEVPFVRLSIGRGGGALMQPSRKSRRDDGPEPCDRSRHSGQRRSLTREEV
jgi:hypothetical protein